MKKKNSRRNFNTTKKAQTKFALHFRLPKINWLTDAISNKLASKWICSAYIEKCLYAM